MVTDRNASVKGHYPKILVVDDDESLRKVLKSLLEAEGFEVCLAESGEQARKLVGLEDFKVVISDFNMPAGDSGLELLKYIKSYHPHLPVILMTGFEKALETQAAFELGARAFLAKPFEIEELVQALRNACRIGEAGQLLEDSDLEKIQSPYADERFCKIAIDQFISGKHMKFEIFTRLAESKYVKVAQEGEDIDADRIQAFKSRGLDFLYIKLSDFAKYVGFKLDLSLPSKDHRVVPPEQKIRLVQNASKVIQEKLFFRGVNQESFDLAREITGTTITLLSESPESFDLLSSLETYGDPLFTHCLAVSLFSVMVAKQVGWDSPTSLFKISTAGLFHDIGLKDIGRAIVGKPRSALTDTEAKLLDTHPARSVEILGGMSSISSDILQIIVQHHEFCSNELDPSRSDRNLIARLISVVDEFCELAFPGVGSPKSSVREVMGLLETTRIDALDLQFIRALEIVLGIVKSS